MIQKLREDFRRNFPEGSLTFAQRAALFFLLVFAVTSLALAGCMVTIAAFKVRGSSRVLIDGILRFAGIAWLIEMTAIMTWLRVFSLFSNSAASRRNDA